MNNRTLSLTTFTSLALSLALGTGCKNDYPVEYSMALGLYDAQGNLVVPSDRSDLNTGGNLAPFEKTNFLACGTKDRAYGGVNVGVGSLMFDNGTYAVGIRVTNESGGTDPFIIDVIGHGQTPNSREELGQFKVESPSQATEQRFTFTAKGQQYTIVAQSSPDKVDCPTFPAVLPAAPVAP